MTRPLRQTPTLPPPLAVRRPVTITSHGQSRVDDYGWLRSPGYPEQISPEIIDYLTAENHYADQLLAPHQALRETILAEMKSRVVAEKFSVPYREGRYYYFNRYQRDSEHPAFYRLDYWASRDCSAGLSAQELAEAKPIFDADARAKLYPFYQLGDFAPSPDGRLLAVSEDRDGSEKHQVIVIDLASGSISELIGNVSGAIVWARDSRSIFVVGLDESQRPRFLTHLTLTGESRQLYEETDNRYHFSIAASASGRRLLASSSARESSEVQWLDLTNPDQGLHTVVPRREGHIYRLFEKGDDFLILTNDRHRNFRLCHTTIAASGEGHWREVIAPSDDHYLTDCVAMRGWFAVSLQHRGLTQIRVITAEGDHSVDFPDAAYSVGFGAMAADDLVALRLNYSSPIMPLTVYDYHPREDRLEVLKQDQIPGHDPQKYLVERLWVARDLVEIPVTLIRRKDRIDQPQPLLLYGYGAYGLGMEAGFREQRFSLIDRGIGFAIAHIRGGDELGWDWYLGGKLQNKVNSFDDFIAVAEALVAQGVTAVGRIVIMGGSAGGLLMGAVVNRAAQGLFGGVLALVPFVDVLNTMEDETLPLTPGEYLEWGNPTIKAEYDWIRAYSPYENLEARAYPPIYLSAGLYDPRVTYWEPAKYCARLRQVKQNDAVVLLRTQMAAGHQGATGRYSALAELAEEYLFVVLVLQQ